MCDVTNQQLCENCIKMLNLFVEFRNKCILAHNVMQTDYVFEEVNITILLNTSIKIVFKYNYHHSQKLKQEDTKENRHIMKNGDYKREIDENQEITTDVHDIQDFPSTDDQFGNYLDEIEVKCNKFIQGILLILYKI